MISPFGLTRTFGQRYAAYCEQVPRWIGFRAKRPQSRLNMALILIATSLVDHVTKTIALATLAQSDPVPVMTGKC